MASPWPGRGSGAGACPSSTRGRGGHLQTHQDQAHEVPRRRSVSCNRGGTRCACGVGVGGRTLSRGEIGRWGVEVSCDRTGCSFGMAVGMAAPHSLTHLAVRPSPGRLGSLLLGASRSTSLPCAPLPFAFLAQPDDDGRLSRNFLISREKTPPHKLDISIRKCSWPRQGRP